MVWLAIYNSQLFDIECVSCHLQYASDVDIGSATGVRDTKAVYVRSDGYYWVEKKLPICIGRHDIKGMLNILKRRYKGDSYRALLKEFYMYLCLKRDMDKYKLYYKVTDDYEYEITADQIYTIISKNFKLFDSIFRNQPIFHWDKKWYGCLYGYLTPFECRAIASHLQNSGEFEKLPFIVSDRVFRFIFRCLHSEYGFTTPRWNIEYSYGVINIIDPYLDTDLVTDLDTDE